MNLKDSELRLNMRTSITNQPLRRLLLATLLSALVAGCGSGSISGSNGSLAGDTLVGGGGTSTDPQLYLGWKANPDPSTTGYLVLYGPTTDTATTVIADVPIVTAGFDPQAPSVSYRAWGDLGLHPGDTVCFRLRAYNQDGVSDPTLGTCTTV